MGKILQLVFPIPPGKINTAIGLTTFLGSTAEFRKAELSFVAEDAAIFQKAE